MNAWKLYRGTDVIGIITDPNQAGPDFTAKLELTPAAAKWKEVIDYIIGPKETGADPPEHLKLFEDWYVEMDGEMIAIYPPGFRKDTKYLMWRWQKNEDGSLKSVKSFA